MSFKTKTDLERQAKQSRRYFVLRSYPRFGRGPFSAENPPEAVLNSPYYWWFVFLRLNERYRETCLNMGEGPCAELYQDFGDIYSMDFKQWWSQEKIADLFAEPVTSYKMLIARSSEELVPFDSDEAINLVVPLNWSRRGLQKRFSEIINKLVEPGQRGISHEHSAAKYKVNTRWNIQGFKNAYRVYIAMQAATNAGEKLSWADVGIRSGQGKIYGLKEGVKADRRSSHYYSLGREERAASEDIAAKRRTLSILAQQQYRRAVLCIEAAASREFPSLASTKSKLPE